MPTRAHWALAFSLLPWTERRKGTLGTQLAEGGDPPLSAVEARDLAALAGRLSQLQDEAHRLGARLLLPGDPGVDRLLPALPYPVALWVRGTLPPEGPSIAVVGSRKASSRGLLLARDWSRALTQGGVGVLSGLARGIDGAAHGGALEAGPTWGVLGSGLHHPYPAEHQPLMDRMVAAGGGVLTCFPPDAQPLPWHFPKRNWLLAAWTQGVLVVEGGLRSGSLVTARLALDLGRELWVIPGRPEDPGSEGPLALLREGAARAARNPGDLLEDLGLPRPEAQGPSPRRH